jgi:hypothetical protein
MPRVTLGVSQPVKKDKTVAIITLQPTEPSAFDSSSMALNAVRGDISGPPAERGKYIW